MGEMFCFDQQWDQENEKWIMGFCYQTEKTNYVNIFVEFDEWQKKQADEIMGKVEALQKEQEEMIKRWIP
ncbi:MAG: hypothetical protein GY797_31510 [Deltaproteobacteria bacterium]|nr:hypothetical protein [Deltaproteobacteria bacterium]